MRRHDFQIPVLTQGEERRLTGSKNTADKDEIKKWFDLDRYAEAKSLNLIEWYYQIFARQEISFFQGKRLQDAFNHFDMPISIEQAGELKQNVLVTWNNILSLGVLPTQRGYFLRDISLYSSIRELEGLPGVHYPHETTYYLSGYRNHAYLPRHVAAFLWDLLDHIQIFIQQESPLNVENGLATIHTGTTFIDRPHNYRNRTRIHLELDLSAGEPQLKKDFDQLLKKNWLPDQNHRKRQTDFSKAARSWCKHQVLAYMDLALWETLNGYRIRQDDIKDLLFPDWANPRSGIDADHMLKTTRAQAESLMTIGTLIQLAYALTRDKKRWLTCWLP